MSRPSLGGDKHQADDYIAAADLMKEMVSISSLHTEVSSSSHHHILSVEQSDTSRAMLDDLLNHLMITEVHLVDLEE